MKQWQCTICKYVHTGDNPPEKCPICGADASKFIEITAVSDTAKEPVKETAPVKPGPEIPLKEKGKASSSAIRETGFEKIESLLVKHHAHPVLVHTPNGILPVAVFLFILAWIFGYDLLGRVAFINLIFVILSLPFVLFTGIVEWKRKYNGAMTFIFKLKILAATITVISCTISLAWFLIDPGILSSAKAWAFIFINCVMLAAAGVAGHIGGKLVFKD